MGYLEFIYRILSPGIYFLDTTEILFKGHVLISENVLLILSYIFILQ